MKNYYIPFLVISAFVLISTVGAKNVVAQTPLPANDDVISIETNLVVFDILVREEKSKRIVNNLQSEDFVVYEDKQPQKIISFSQDRTPLSIVLLLDVSASMSGTLKKLQDEAKSALSFLRSEDEVAIAVFAGKGIIVSESTTDREVTLKTIASVNEKEVRRQAGGGTTLVNGVYEAADYLNQKDKKQKRRVIVAITDNIVLPIKDKSKEDSIADWVYTSEISVCGIIVESALAETRRKIHPVSVLLSVLSGGGINRYAEKSGGFVVDAREGEVAEKLGEMFENLRRRYVIGYEPSNANLGDDFRQLKVELSVVGKAKISKRIDIKYKKGYRFAKKSNLRNLSGATQ